MSRAWRTVAEAKIRVLVVEDVQRLAALIVKGLDKAGFDAEAVHTAAAARDCIYDGAFDAVVLDLGLPDQDGLTLLRELREDGQTLPVIILTTRIMVEARIEGLNAGADDYVTKPFEFGELIARLRAVLRRPAAVIADVLKVGNISFDTQNREVLIADSGVSLPPKELTLLELLMRKPSGVVSKVFLEDNIYGSNRDGAANSLEVLTHRLRVRLRELGADVEIHTVRGVGYMLTGETVKSS